MTSLEIVGLVAVILMSAFAIVAIAVAVPLFRLLSRANNIIGSINNKIDPLVEDLNSIVSNMNSEVSSINDITRSASSIVEQLEKVVKLARIILTSPIIKVISTTAGIFGAAKKASEKK